MVERFTVITVKLRLRDKHSSELNRQARAVELGSAAEACFAQSTGDCDAAIVSDIVKARTTLHEATSTAQTEGEKR